MKIMEGQYQRKIIQNINLSSRTTLSTNATNINLWKTRRPPLSPTGMFLSFILMFPTDGVLPRLPSIPRKDQFWRRQLHFDNPPDLRKLPYFLKRESACKHLNNSSPRSSNNSLNQRFLNLHMVAEDGSASPKPAPMTKYLGMGPHPKLCLWIQNHVAVDVNTELPVAITFTGADTHWFNTVQTNLQQNNNIRHWISNTILHRRYSLRLKSIRQTLLKEQGYTNHQSRKNQRIKPQYPTRFKRNLATKKRTAVERFFSDSKEIPRP